MDNYDEQAEFDYYDREQKKQKAKEYLEGMQALQQEQQQKYTLKTFSQVDKKHAKRFMEAAKKKGYTERHLAQLHQDNPGLYYEAVNAGRKHYNKYLLQALDTHFGRSRPTGRQPLARQRRPDRDSERILESAREKASRGKALRFDEEDALLDVMLGDLF